MKKFEPFEKNELFVLISWNQVKIIFLFTKFFNIKLSNLLIIYYF